MDATPTQRTPVTKARSPLLSLLIVGALLLVLGAVAYAMGVGGVDTTSDDPMEGINAMWRPIIGAVLLAGGVVTLAIRSAAVYLGRRHD